MIAALKPTTFTNEGIMLIYSITHNYAEPRSEGDG